MAFKGFLKVISRKSTANTNGRINDRKAMGNCEKYITEKEYYIKTDTIDTAKEKRISKSVYNKLSEQEKQLYTHRIKTKDELISVTNLAKSKDFTKQTCKLAKQNGFNVDDKDFKRLATHMVQGFSTYDDITPELAHKIGVEFAEKMFPHCAVLVTTHIDHLDENGKGYLHNHFLICDCTLNKTYEKTSAYQDSKNPNHYIDKYQYNALNADIKKSFKSVEDVTIRVLPHKLHDGNVSFNRFGEHSLNTAKEFCQQQYRNNNLEWSLLSEKERKSKLASIELEKVRNAEKNTDNQKEKSNVLQPFYQLYREIIDRVIEKSHTFKEFKKLIQDEGIKVSRDSYERNSIYFAPVKNADNESKLKPVSGAKLDIDEHGNNLGRYTRRAIDELIGRSERNTEDSRRIDDAIRQFTKRTGQGYASVGVGRNESSDSKTERVIEPIRREPERDSSRDSKTENRNEGITRIKRSDFKKLLTTGCRGHKKLSSATERRRQDIAEKLSRNNQRINQLSKDRDKQKELERTRENASKRGKSDEPSTDEKR